MSGVPAAEIDIDVALVARLVELQCPEMAGRPIAFVGSGWDNELDRLGDHHVARLPRRQAAAELVEHEQRWLPSLSPVLPISIAAPVFAGHPAGDYPWRWSICPWFPGAPASESRLVDPAAGAEQLGRFVAALHQPSPPDAPANPHRGVPLADRDERTRASVERLDGVIDVPATIAGWERALAVPAWTRPAVWLHGDLHPGNVVVHGGRIEAVVDFGDVCGGDPATDLLIAWSLFDRPAREVFRAAAAVDDDTWERGRGWALTHSVAVLAASADNPAYMAFGRRGIAAALGT